MCIRDRPDVIIVDMRNHYESEVGHFENAITPDAATFREESVSYTHLTLPTSDLV